MAGLADKVEHHLLPRQHPRQHRLVAQVAELGRQPRLQALDVVAQAALIGPQAVDQGDVRAQLHQPPREVGADEAQAAGHQDASASEG